MILTEAGKDIICVNEENFYKNDKETYKIHLIKLKFFHPNHKKIKWCLNNYPSTKRFIIEDNVKIYNDILKKTKKKYYVENSKNTGLISFFKKNNKVFLNLFKCSDNEQEFILNNILYDVLKNIEIIYISKKQFLDHKNVFFNWNGNVILHNEEYSI